MIILQIFAGLLLIPLTVLLAMVFNIYFRNWVFWLAMIVDSAVYAFFCGVLFLSSSMAMLIFILLCIGFVARRNYLAENLRNENLPLLYAQVRRKKFLIDFVFVLSCLNIFKYFPDALNRKISIKTDLQIKVWLEQFLLNCQGAKIYILDDDLEINCEIK